MAFERASDHGAFDIEATGVDCQVARDVAGRAEGRIGEPYDHPSGFSCRAERDEDPTLTFTYTCTRGSDRITFIAS